MAPVLLRVLTKFQYLRPTRLSKICVATNGHLAIPVAPQASKLVLPAASAKIRVRRPTSKLRILERTARKAVFRPTRWLAPGFVTFPYEDLSVLYHPRSGSDNPCPLPRCEIQIFFGGSIRIPEALPRRNRLMKIFSPRIPTLRPLGA